MLGFPLGILSAAGAAVGAVGDYELIATDILAGTAASVTFSNLGDYSSTYKHLQIRAVGKTLRAANQDVFQMRLNGDTGSNYSEHNLNGDGTSVTSAAGTSTTSMNAGVFSGNATANEFGAAVIDLLDAYSTSKNKTIRSLSGKEGVAAVGGSGKFIYLMSGVWRDTSSVTSITLTPLNANLVAGSRFSLYGIRG